MTEQGAQSILGLELSQALEALQARSITPRVERTAGRRLPDRPVWRVVRVREDGRELVAAAFPPPAGAGEIAAEEGV